MAFTTRGVRGKEFTSLSATSPDPGAYQVCTWPEQAKTAYAPFVSTVEKGSQPAGTAPLLQGAPVGTYKTTQEWTTRPGVTKTGLPCRYVPFACSSVRFGGSGRKDRMRATEPGPGDYRLSEMADIPRYAAKSMGRAPQGSAELRALSAPSIPVGHQSHGYSESRGGLVRQAAPHNFAGRANDSIAPNQYDPSTATTKRAVAVRRFGTESRGGSLKNPSAKFPGPGTYPTKKFGLNADRPGAWALSAVERSEEPKGDEKPGPGTYMPKVGLKKGAKRTEHQFFNSTAERFRGPQQDEAPGPGNYKPKQEKLRTTNFGGKYERFGGHGDFTEPWRSCCDPDAPGPGSYEIEGMVPAPQDDGWGSPTVTVKSHSVLSQRGAGAFGSQTKRWTAKTVHELPGPGQYPQQDAGDAAKKQFMSRPGASFKFAGKRIQPTRTEDGAEPGTYDPQLPSGLVPRMARKDEGFGGAETRFKYLKEGEHHPVPGPGEYAVAKPLASGTANRAVQHSGLGWASSERREDPTIKLRTKQDVPGPGTYLPPDGWVKKSHNQLFTDGLPMPAAGRLSPRGAPSLAA